MQFYCLVRIWHIPRLLNKNILRVLESRIILDMLTNKAYNKNLQQEDIAFLIPGTKVITADDWKRNKNKILSSI